MLANRRSRLIAKFLAASALAGSALLSPAAGAASAAMTTPGANQVPPDRVVTLINKQGQVLEDSFGTLTLGFRNNSDDEKWIKDYRTVDGSIVRLENVASGRCVFAPQQSSLISKVTMGECNLTNRAHNEWRITPQPGGHESYTTYFGKPKGLAITSFNNLNLQQLSGTENQLFREG
ncbi:hypothetical protein FHX44_113832 [Pseudonocardia hierapolitana]|uniref:Uncharacterized protein n=1 Tax=Pseudonocardia hierapolitana TaxID=1128676 RepID=A0A561SSR8_9PSEU|nr:hypothetical protein [Pseudonocardia hierapolitana]TWF77916.1 hypothetical protein FHX44_113832 [Pseudonocardia hierapolitana]